MDRHRRHELLYAGDPDCSWLDFRAKVDAAIVKNVPEEFRCNVTIEVMPNDYESHEIEVGWWRPETDKEVSDRIAKQALSAVKEKESERQIAINMLADAMQRLGVHTAELVGGDQIRLEPPVSAAA